MYDFFQQRAAVDEGEEGKELHFFTRLPFRNFIEFDIIFSSTSTPV